MPQDTGYDQLPPPTEWSGKKFKDWDTGQVFQSDGTKWVPLPSQVPQGPSALQQMGRGALTGLGATLPALIPGVGLGMTALRFAAESALPMAAATLAQKTWLAEESGEQIAAAGITGPLTRGLLGAPARIRAVGRAGSGAFLPQATRRKGTELVMKELPGGGKVDPLYAAARADPTPLNKDIFGDIVENAIFKESRMANPTGGAVRLLSNLKNKISSRYGYMTYGDMVDEVQRLQDQAETAFGHKNKVTGKVLSQAAKTALDEMDKISPTIKQANAAFRQQSTASAIRAAMRKADPSTAVETLFDENTLVTGALSNAQRKAIQDLADRVGRTAPKTAMGAGRVVMQATAEPFAEQAQEGMTNWAIEMVMRNPRPEVINRSAAIIAAQLARSELTRE